MSSVDDRIVNMQFNSKDFIQGSSESQKSLSDLEKAMNHTAAAPGLSDMGKSVDDVTSRFSAMEIAGVTAIGTIANKAVNAGISMLKSLTIDPISQGFKEYQTNLSSIQVILGNTGKSLGEVQAHLDDLNHYSDLTIYNFSQMASAIGKFTSAGVNLNDSTIAIKGMANAAALSGASAEDLNRAMYQVSQALSAGAIRLIDWKSLENANLGNKAMRDSIMATAHSLGEEGKAMDASIKKHGSFRESLSDGWLTNDIFTKTMKVMAGQYDENTKKTKAYTLLQLKQMGYTDKEAKTIRRLSQASIDAATQVKTLPQLMDVTREAIGSIFSHTFAQVIGGFNSSVKLWSAVSEKISGPKGFITKMGSALDDMLDHWIHVGGRYQIIKGFEKIFGTIGRIIDTFHKAYSDIFPPQAGHTLSHLSYLFRSFAILLSPTSDELKKLRRIFAGIFAIVHIGTTIIGALFEAFVSLFRGVLKHSHPATGGILEFLAVIADGAVKLDKFLTSGGKMQDLFKGIGEAVGKLLSGGLGKAGDLLGGLVGNLLGSTDIHAIEGRLHEMGLNIIAGLANGIGDPAAYGSIKAALEALGQNIIDWLKDKLGIHSPSTVTAEMGKNLILGLWQGILGGITLVITAVGQVVAAIIKGFKGMFSGLDALDVASLLNAIFAGALILTLRKFAQGLSGFGTGIYNVLQQLTSTLKTMQTALRAEALRAIAVSIAILVGAILLMKLIKPGDVEAGVAAIGALLTMMTVSLKSLSNIGKNGDKTAKGMLAQSTRITALAGAFTAMAGAIFVLSGAVVLLGKQKPETLKKGLGSVAIMMALMTTSIGTLAKLGPSVKGAASAIVAMAVALNLLIVPVLILGHTDMKVLAKGLGSVALIMLVMSKSMAAMTKAAAETGPTAAALVAMGIAINLMARSVAILGKMSLWDLAKGMLALVIGLNAMTAAIVAVGTLGPEATAAGLALLALGAGLYLFAKAMAVLGGMSLWDLGKALVFLVAGLVALGVVALAMAATGAAEALLAVGVAVAAIGAGIFLAGAGVALFAAGLAILATVGTAAIGIMVAAINAFIALLPSIAIQMAAAFVSFLETLAKAAPRIRKAMDDIFKAMLGVIMDADDDIAKLFQHLIDTALKVIVHSASDFAEAGFQIIDNFIASARKHVPQMAENGLGLVTALLKAIAKNLGPLADSAAKLIIAYINAIADAIENNVDGLRKAGLHLAGAIVDGMTGGLLTDGVKKVKEAAEAIADKLPGWMKKVLHIKSPSRVMMEIGFNVAAGLAQGIINHVSLAVNAVRMMANAVLAEGNKSVLKAQKIASKAQKAADLAQARANATKSAAYAIRKTNPTRSKELEARAEREQKIADQMQARADSAASRVDRAKEFANADLHTKGDMRNEDAVRQASEATRMLAKAQAEAREARELMKTNRAAGLAMLERAKKDAEEAARLAAAAKRSHAAAQKYYAMEVNQRIKALQAAKAADDKAKADQAAYDAADYQGKLDILNQRKAADQAKADAAAAKAAALIKQAKALAATDATKAMKLLDQAEEQSQIAQDAAEAAQQDKDAIEQLMGQGPEGAITDYTPSANVLADAAQAFDRYTLSLADAEAAAAATPQAAQFIQNNYSPEAISASDSYRLGKNLLSLAEDNLAVKPS